MTAPFRPARAHGEHLRAANSPAFNAIDAEANADARSILRAAKETQASIQAECDRTQALYEIPRMERGGYCHE
jgi:hypothetical protein